MFVNMHIVNKTAQGRWCASIRSCPHGQRPLHQGQKSAAEVISKSLARIVNYREGRYHTAKKGTGIIVERFGPRQCMMVVQVLSALL